MAEASDGEHYPPPEGDAGSVSLPDDASIMDIEKEGGAFCSTRHTLRWLDIPPDKLADEQKRQQTYGSFAGSGKEHKTKRSYKGLKLKKWLVHYFNKTAEQCSKAPHPNLANQPVENWRSLA